MRGRFLAEAFIEAEQANCDLMNGRNYCLPTGAAVGAVSVCGPSSVFPACTAVVQRCPGGS